MVTLRKSIGFTIVELLIVIVVIAILAAITIVAYNGIQDRANNATVRSDISAANKQLEIARIDLDHYPTSSSEFPTGFKFSKTAYQITTHNVLYCINKTTGQYALGLISKSTKGYMLVSGVVTEDVSVTPANVCAAVGKTWVNDATTYTKHGYVYGSTGWNTSWSWTS